MSTPQDPGKKKRKALGKFLHQLRNEKHLSIKDVAFGLDCDNRSVRRWERGETWPLPRYMRGLLGFYGLERFPDFDEEGEQKTLHTDQRAVDSPQYIGSTQPAISAGWEDALADEPFMGREAELLQVEQWLLAATCRIVLVLGQGGIGKSSFVYHIAERNIERFDALFWISLRNAPSIEQALEPCLQRFTTSTTLSQPEDTAAQRITHLLEVAQQYRCLFIIDNVESILHGGDEAGQYLPGYEGYEELFSRLSKLKLQSRFLLTSRELPKKLEQPQTTGIHALTLHNLELESCMALLHYLDLKGEPAVQKRLIELYSGNPFALKLISASIRRMYAGEIAAFLAQGEPLFEGIVTLLQQQIARLSPLEQALLFWLAIEREPVTWQALSTNVNGAQENAIFLKLHMLEQRSLIESRGQGRFALQPLVINYLTELLIAELCTQIEASQMRHLGQFALVKAQSRAYIRTMQRQFLLKPLADCLLRKYTLLELREKLYELLNRLPADTARSEQSYAAGNILNLLIYLDTRLHGLDLSRQVIRQADFRGVELHNVNLSQASLQSCAFSDTFTCILCLAVSHDGQFLAAGTTTGEVRVWRTSDNALVFVGNEHTEEVRCVTFNRAGLLASAAEDHTVRLWNLENGRSSCLTSRDLLRSVSFHANGRLLACASEDCTVDIWDVQDERLLHTLRYHTERVRSVAFHPTQDILATGGDDTTVCLWNTTTWELQTTHREHTAPVHVLAFSPDGRFLVSGSEDQTIHVWELDGPLAFSLRGHTSRIRTLAFSADSRYLISGSDDATVRLWDLYTQQLFSTLHGHTSRVWAVAYLPQSMQIVSGCEDDTLRWWDFASGRSLQITHGYTDLIKGVAFQPHGELLASGSEDRTLRLWNIRSGELFKTLRGHEHRVRTIAFSPGGELLASGSEDEKIQLWDTETRHVIKTLHGHTHLVRTLVFDTTGSKLLSSGYDSRIITWSADTGQQVALWLHPYGRVWSLALHPDNELVASSGDNPIICLWSRQQGVITQELSGHSGRVSGVAFSPNGRYLASCSDDKTIRLWNLTTGACEKVLTGHESWVRALAFSPDGTRLASCSHDLTVRLWDVEHGELLQILRGHRGWIWSVAFSNDGQSLASAGDDGTIRLWNLVTGKTIRTLRRDRPYEGLLLNGVRGISQAQKETLIALGASENEP